MVNRTWVPCSFALVAICGCGSSNASSSPGDAGDEGLVPPASPNGPKTSVAAQHAYAIHRLYLGSSARVYPPVLDPTAWASYGYDLDGKTTTATSTDVCTPYAGAPAASQVDGTRGIDNSFGENIVPIMVTVAGNNVEMTVDGSINAGDFTDLFVVTGWDDANVAQTATALSAVVLVGNKYPTMPSWTTSDHWPIDDGYLGPSALGTAPIANANLKLSTSYVVGGEFVSGSRVDVPIDLELGGHSLPLVVHQGIITWQNDGTGHINQGTIAGVLTTAEFVSAAAGSATDDGSLCEPMGPATITSQLLLASDILHDGTNVPGVPCDGISIGLGFDADEVAIPVAADVAAAPPALPDLCSTDAGD
jgi:hypothetical protein